MNNFKVIAQTDQRLSIKIMHENNACSKLPGKFKREIP